MEQNQIDIKKKKFNRLLYLICLLFTLLISYVSLTSSADLSNMVGKSEDEMQGYIVGIFFGKIVGIILLSYILYFILNWLNVHFIKNKQNK